MFSIALLAVCNANYEFTLADIGEAGRQSNGGINNNNSKLGMTIDRNMLTIPEPTTINEYSDTKKFHLFSLQISFRFETFMSRPFPRRNDLNLYELILNYRLSRARRVIENTFGILISRFRIFRRSIIGKTGNIKYITKAAVILHNFLKCKSTRNMY